MWGDLTNLEIESSETIEDEALIESKKEQEIKYLCQLGLCFILMLGNSLFWFCYNKKSTVVHEYIYFIFSSIFLVVATPNRSNEAISCLKFVLWHFSTFMMQIIYLTIPILRRNRCVGAVV
jgi:hypothetical protein